jgi:oligopeptide/dipeptide ABC transporter ATP-binding protein
MKGNRVLSVENLSTVFGGPSGVTVVDGVSFDLSAGRTTALVGESGSGKSVTALSIMRLIDPPGRIASGRILFDGRDLLALDEADMQAIRGARIAMIFQDPLTSLNPALTIGRQITEMLRAHLALDRGAAEARAIELLTAVGVKDAARRFHDYPHHFSGGMRQRVLIAAAIGCHPSIIIADEPTTALDVTIQAKILRLIHDLQQEIGAALLLITHDLGVVATMADDVMVMHAGRIVERADVDSLFHNPQHPYTRALLACVAAIEGARSEPLLPLDGTAPDLRSPPPGCRFAPQCPLVRDVCRSRDPALVPVSATQSVACLLVEESVRV